MSDGLQVPPTSLQMNQFQVSVQHVLSIITTLFRLLAGEYSLVRAEMSVLMPALPHAIQRMHVTLGTATAARREVF